LLYRQRPGCPPDGQLKPSARDFSTTNAPAKIPTSHGKNPFGLELHEFRLSVVNGELQINNVNGQAGTADAVWEAVPPSDRPINGNYVNTVLNTQI
jgi:hypothetical protein